MGSKVGCFAGFCHHYLTTMSVHMHVYHYPLFESGTKRVCEQSLYAGKTECYYVNTKNNSKNIIINFSYNDD